MDQEPLSDDAIIAHHEAAHATLAIELGMGLLDVGVDLKRVDATGGIGNVGCRLFVAELEDVVPSELEAEQRRLMGEIDCNGTVLAAGAAAEAKLRGEEPWLTLHKQQSDLNKMRDLLRRAQLGATEDEDQRLRLQLDMAVDALNDPAIWRVVEAVAQAVLETGTLSGSAIEQIAEPMLGPSAKSPPAS